MRIDTTLHFLGENYVKNFPTGWKLWPDLVDGSYYGIVRDLANTELKLNAGIGQPYTRSLKGHVVSPGLDLCSCCVRCRGKKASQVL